MVGGAIGGAANGAANPATARAIARSVPSARTSTKRPSAFSLTRIMALLGVIDSLRSAKRCVRPCAKSYGGVQRGPPVGEQHEKSPARPFGGKRLRGALPRSRAKAVGLIAAEQVPGKRAESGPPATFSPHRSIIQPAKVG